MEWLLVICVFVISFIFLFGALSNNANVRSKENKELINSHHARLDLENAAARERLADFEKALDVEWPLREQSSGGSRYREYLMMSADQRLFRIANVSFHPGVEILKSLTVSVQTIVSVELQQSSETVMRMDSVSTTKKGSPLLRAAIGGIAFGGAGAVVGAVSAKQTTTGKTTGKSETRKGPIYLVIGTTDFQTPMVKFKMSNMDVAEQWLHRLRGAISMCRPVRADED